MATLLVYAGKSAEALAACQLARADQEVLAAVPGASNDARRELADTIERTRLRAVVHGQARRGGARVPHGAGDLSKAGRRKSRRHRVPHAAWRAATLSRQRAALDGQAGGGGGGIPQRRWRSSRSWWTKPRRHELPQEPGGQPAVARPSLLLHDGQAGGGGGRVPQGAGDLPEAGGRRSRRSPTSAYCLAFVHSNLGLLLLQTGKPAEAEAECRKALAILQKLADDNPAVTLFGDRLAFALIDLGDVVRSLGRADEAKGCYDRAIASEGTRVQDGSDERGAPLRSGLLDAAARAGPSRPRRRRRSGRRYPASARSCATGCYRGRPGTSSRSRWPAVTRRSRAWPGGPDRVSRRPRGRRAAARAMEWLDRAVASGYRNTNQLRIESALDPLRDRPDFKKLMAELEKNSPPQQEKK